jgi:hypothetical protein
MAYFMNKGASRAAPVVKATETAPIDKVELQKDQLPSARVESSPDVKVEKASEETAKRVSIDVAPKKGRADEIVYLIWMTEETDEAMSAETDVDRDNAALDLFGLVLNYLALLPPERRKAAVETYHADLRSRGFSIEWHETALDELVAALGDEQMKASAEIVRAKLDRAQKTGRTRFM